MFENMVELTREYGVKVTPLVLHASMKADPAAKEIKLHEYFAGLAEGSPALPNIRDYARIIADLHVRRLLIQAGEDFVNAAYEQPLELPTAKVLAQAETALQRIHADHGAVLHTRRPRAATDVAQDAMRNLEERMSGKEGGMVSSGFRKLDEVIGGYGGGDLVIICGRPGMGKSTLMSCTAVAAALEQRPVLVITNEMRAQQWIERSITYLDYAARDAMDYPLHYQKFRRASLTNKEFERAVLASQRFHTLDYEICDDEAMTVEDIASRARAFKRARPGCRQGLIVVDYLQRIRESELGRGTNRATHVGHMARGLKSLGKELDWPVVAASSNNRESEQRNDKDRKPRLSDLRESGDIESEADLVAGPYRKAYYIGKERPEGGESDPEWPAWQVLYRQWKNVVDLCILKNRHGESDQEVRLFADMGAAVMLDNEVTAVSQAQSDLALGLG